MSLLDVHAESAGQAYDRQLRNPGPEPEAGFSITSFLGSGLTAPPAAALERSGFFADILSGFGTAAASADSRAGGMFSLPTPEEQKQQEDARQRMLKSEAFDVTAGNVLRKKAQEFGPDPLTSHKADQVLHGLVRFGTKAAVDVGTLGPAAGALLLGTEEGNTVTQDLRAKGVDTETAAKVGVVQGGLSALGTVLPLSAGGSTLLQRSINTIGLVGVGGPGSYMAQEALSREILQAAGYQNEASLHNPFDPLGLTLSTVIPGGFGALHMRGTFRRAEAVKSGALPLEQMKPEELRALKYNDPRLDAYASATAERYGVPPAILLAIKNAGEKSDPTAVSPKGAKGVMQFMPGTAKEMGLADATDPVASIDAGARYLKKLHDAYGSWDAAVAHYNGGGAQAAIVRGGGRPTYNETAGYLDRVQKYVAERTAQEAAKSPEAVDAARVAVLNDTVARSLPDTPDAMAQVQRAADIVAESGGRRAEAEVPEPMVTLYHGSPHEFSAFDSSRIGTGEGAQAFGHGIYLAENQGVASFYRDTLSRVQDAGGSVRNAATRDAANNWIEKAGGDRQKAATEFMAFAEEAGLREQDPGLYRETLAAIENPPGFIYKAQIPRSVVDKMIDLDAPIEQQPKAVQDYFRRVGAYKSGKPLTEHMAIDKFAAEEFSKAGIPGLRYLDATARADGAGTANYVLFPGQEGAVVLAERNGTALREADNTLPDADQVKLAGDAAKAAVRAQMDGLEAQATALKEAPPEQPEAPAAQQSPAATLDQAIAQKIALEQPDLQVILPGDDAPVSVKEALKRIDAERVQDAQWADLVRVAAECALTA
jgi:hypothetical protein